MTIASDVNMDTAQSQDQGQTLQVICPQAKDAEQLSEFQWTHAPFVSLLKICPQSRTMTLLHAINDITRSALVLTTALLCQSSLRTVIKAG